MDVNSERRRYDAPIRRERTEASRRRMLDCARQLFVGNGYAATSVEDIAAAAGVGRRSIYDAFGSKRGILLALLDQLAPQEEQRFNTALAQAAGDATVQLGLAVGFITTLYARAIDILDMVHAAGGADSDLAALDREGERRRLQAQRSTVRDWHRRGLLSTGMNANTAADILWTMTSPHLYRMLVVERGWSKARFRGWLIDQLTHELLTDPALTPDQPWRTHPSAKR
ncbi:MAG: TetR/AcrR family transcriptional regulator [Pseudonocardiaceae bacterium]